MGCFFSKPKTDIWNDEVQGFDNLAVDEKEVSGRTSQTFDFKKAEHRSRRRYSSEHSGIWMNLDKQIYLGRDSKGTQTVVNTTSQMVQTDMVWRMFDDKEIQTENDVNDDDSFDENVSRNQEFDLSESVVCGMQSENGFQNGYEREMKLDDVACEVKNMYRDNECVENGTKNEKNGTKNENEDEIKNGNNLSIELVEIDFKEKMYEENTLQLEKEKLNDKNVGKMLYIL